MIRFILLFTLLCLPMKGSFAQEELNIRSGVHPNYSRLVFDWNNQTDYQITRENEKLVITFSANADAQIAASQKRQLDNVQSINIISGKAEPLKLELIIPETSKHRGFTIGNRVILDIYNPDSGQKIITSKESAVSKPKEVISPAKKEQTVKEEKKESKSQKKLAEKSKEITTSAPAPKVEQVKAETLTFEPHVITITSTNKIGMAVYQRAGSYWLLIDQPNNTILPTIDGPQKDQIQALERFDVVGGTLYRLKIPKDLNIYGEGGNLRWRIVFGTGKRKREPIQPEIQINETVLVRGGSLFLPTTGVTKILTYKDPLIGDVLQVATVESSDLYTDRSYEYVELETLISPVGFAMRPHVDDLQVTQTDDGVMIRRPNGLSLSRIYDTLPHKLREGTASESLELEEDVEEEKITRLYNFQSWQMGGIKSLKQNQAILLSALAHKDASEQTADILTLAKLNLANNRSFEALGYLRVAKQIFSDIEESPEYIALRGAAAALSQKYDLAIKDLSQEALIPYGEIGYWKAYALAGLEDWKQAVSVMPKSFGLIKKYPLKLQKPIVLKLAEIALRDGRVNIAKELLAILEPHKSELELPYKTAWNYLNGELFRQSDEIEKAKSYWKPLLASHDDLHRVRAGLALTRLELKEGDINAEQAVNRLEGLRYAWRGDELETLINFRLGQVYIDNKEYIKGLSVLRNAASLLPDSKMAKEVTAYMANIFRDVFVGQSFEGITALDAVGIYDEFKELTPLGEEGDVLISQLSERLVEADLLSRAGKLLDHQIIHRLEGEDAGRTAIRLAAIRLLDDKPDGALRALDKAEASYRELNGGSLSPATNREITLLRARAHSKSGDTQKALFMLEELGTDQNINRLRADIAWNANLWEDAADALQDIIFAEDISLTRPPTPAQANLLLNRAIALNLAQNRVALANLRERYGDAMTQSEQARMFEVVTRPRQSGLLGNRETMNALISEVDLFKDFLDSYRNATSN